MAEDGVKAGLEDAVLGERHREQKGNDGNGDLQNHGGLVWRQCYAGWCGPVDDLRGMAGQRFVTGCRIDENGLIYLRWLVSSCEHSRTSGIELRACWHERVLRNDAMDTFLKHDQGRRRTLRSISLTAVSTGLAEEIRERLIHERLEDGRAYRAESWAWSS